jgi:diadenylate cyclase
MNPADLLSTVNGRDLIDILAVALAVYALLLLIRGTRSVQWLLGILVLVGISYVAKLAGLVTLERLIGIFVAVIPFAIIVIFQDQIREALATFGTTSLLGLGTPQIVELTLNEIVRTASALAKSRTGALIVLEGKQGLREYTEKGTRLDAEVSAELLMNIFTPNAPLHDGAVIVRGDRIAAAGCFLPLTKQLDIDSDLGTRHRAALGISDQSDALALVVSEETGHIAIAFDGQLTRHLDSGGLHALLLEQLSKQQAEESDSVEEVSQTDGADGDDH